MRRYKIEISDKQYSIDVEDVDVNHFRVMLDNQTYDVNLSFAEDLAGAEITPAMMPASQPAPIERPTTSPRPVEPKTPERAPNAPPLAPATTTKVSRSNLTAPMPGTIQEILVKPGDRVKRGQTVLILEAMKMKNAIKSPQEGVIGKVIAEQGKAVRHGDVLVCFEEPTR